MNDLSRLIACPFCGEKIRKLAKRCKQCKTQLSENPPYTYIKENYSIHDEYLFDKISDILYEIAYISANKFSRTIKKESTEDLVHYFFDYYLINLSFGFFKEFYKNNDIYSAIIDGIHFNYYGSISKVVIHSILDIPLIGDTDCFFLTFMKESKNVQLTTHLAYFCIDRKEKLRLLDCLELAEVLTEIFIYGKIEYDIKIRNFIEQYKKGRG